MLRIKTTRSEGKQQTPSLWSTSVGFLDIATTQHCLSIRCMGVASPPVQYLYWLENEKQEVLGCCSVRESYWRALERGYLESGEEGGDVSYLTTFLNYVRPRGSRGEGTGESCRERERDEMLEWHCQQGVVNDVEVVNNWWLGLEIWVLDLVNFQFCVHQ